MYFKISRSIKCAILLLLLVNAALWFLSDPYCQSTVSHEILANRRRRDLKFQEKLVELHQAILRVKRNEIDLDELLAHFVRETQDKNEPTIYCITPTYSRPTQKADLTRLCQTLRQVPNFRWIVIEDSEHKTGLVSRLLERCGVTYTHFAIKTSKHLRRKADKPRWRTPRGMEQRNKGLEWVRKNFDPKKMKGVVYFADDDNTYDLEIFRKMRQTKTVSVWPVGLVGGLRWEGPVCENNTIVNFRVAYKPKRTIPIDMAGFAINAKLVANNPRLLFNPNVVGSAESSFLSKVTSRHKLEPPGDLCNKVLVWHTRTEAPSLHREAKMIGKSNKSFPDLEC